MMGLFTFVNIEILYVNRLTGRYLKIRVSSEFARQTT